MFLDALPTEDEVLERLVAWAQTRAEVRAVLLSSSRARPEPGVDLLSDYDVILAVTEPESFLQDADWQAAYAQPLASWGDQGQQAGQTTYFRGVVYTNFVKIDYSIWPLGLLEHITSQASLLPELDAGYRVLLDKDARTASWPEPSYQAFRPKRPSAAEYQALIEEFWWGATYVAKSLWRDELLFARWVLDNDLKLGSMRKLLEWRVALDHGWSVRPGVLGRSLKRRLPADLWDELASTYVGPEPEANWQALFRTADLFRRVALQVGAAFGYPYPEPLDQKMRGYIEQVRALPPHPGA